MKNVIINVIFVYTTPLVIGSGLCVDKYIYI